MRLKNTAMPDPVLEKTRRLFLFMYYCYGISFIDAAMLTRSNLENCNCGTYIVYKRNKTKDNKDSRPIRIRISTEINLLLDWFSSHTHLYGDYLLPIVSVPGYSGERLYSHIRGRYKHFSRNLNNLGLAIGLKGFRLTSYVARHTMAMTLQEHHVPREIISQSLGHKDLSTTSVYLDSFADSIIDEAARVL